MAKKIGEASGYTGSAFLDRSVIGNVQKGSYGSPGGSGKKSRYSEVYGKRPATFGDYFKDAKDKFGKLKKMASKIEGMSKSPELANERTITPMQKPDPKKLTGLSGNTELASKDIKSMPIKSLSTTGNTELAKKSLPSPMTPEEVEKARPKGNSESILNTNAIESSIGPRWEADINSDRDSILPSPTEGSDYRFNLGPNTNRSTSGMSNIEGNAYMGRRNFREALMDKEDAISNKDIIEMNKTEVEGIPADFLGSGSDSGVFQKSDAYGKAMMRSGLYQKSYNAKKYK